MIQILNNNILKNKTRKIVFKLVKYKNNFKKFKKNKVRTILVFFYFLISLELFLQIISFTRYIIFKKKEDNVVNPWYFSDPSYSWWMKDAKFIEATFSPFVEWKTVLTNNIVNINLNDLGNRSTTNSNSDTKLKSIYFFGGSTVWGYLLKDSETIPSIVNYQLNEYEKDYRIENYGQIGFTTSQDVINLVLQLERGNIPNYAIFIGGCNDVTVNLLDKYPQTIISQNNIKKRLGNMFILGRELNSNNSLINPQLINEVAKFLVKYIKVVDYSIKAFSQIFYNNKIPIQISYNSQNSEEEIMEMAKTISEDYLSQIKFVDHLSKEFNFEYIFIWQPSLVTKSKIVDSREIDLLTPDVMKTKNLYSITTGLIEEENPKNYYNASKIFDLSNNLDYFDTCHLTPAANEFLSDWVLKIILNKWKL